MELTGNMDWLSHQWPCRNVYNKNTFEIYTAQEPDCMPSVSPVVLPNIHIQTPGYLTQHCPTITLIMLMRVQVFLISCLAVTHSAVVWTLQQWNRWHCQTPATPRNVPWYLDSVTEVLQKCSRGLWVGAESLVWLLTDLTPNGGDGSTKQSLSPERNTHVQGKCYWDCWSLWGPHSLVSPVFGLVILLECWRGPITTLEPNKEPKHTGRRVSSCS